MQLKSGDLVEGKYRIVGLRGKGGMGTVYEGEHVRIHRRVAIKVLHPAVAADALMIQRFEREAQAAGRIGSPHIVEVLDLGELPSGARFMVMELLEGESLAERLKTVGKMEPEGFFPIAVQLLDGLAAAHEAGIVHRDLKPGNVFLLPDRRLGSDFVKIVDFGISKFHQLDGEATHTGVVVGTPLYMAPEQARGEKSVDRRADLYSVGVMLFRALSGVLPYRAETYRELMFKLTSAEPIRLRECRPDIDPAVDEIVRRALARDPDERFQSAEELAVALREWLESKGVTLPMLTPPSQSPIRSKDVEPSTRPSTPSHRFGHVLMVGMVVVVVLAAVVGVLVGRTSPRDDARPATAASGLTKVSAAGSISTRPANTAPGGLSPSGSSAMSKSGANGASGATATATARATVRPMPSSQPAPVPGPPPAEPSTRTFRTALD